MKRYQTPLSRHAYKKTVRRSALSCQACDKTVRWTVLSFGIVFLFLIMLICPKAVFTGASQGLLLWFQIILPTLFPFLLVTDLLLATGSIRYISSAFGGILSRIFGVSENGSFAVITGFLCGYPMGAKTAADLTVSNYISREEGQYLLSFCNNTSPVFILNFLVWKTLQDTFSGYRQFFYQKKISEAWTFFFGAPLHCCLSDACFREELSFP